MNPTINVHTIIPRSFIQCRAKRAAKYMNSARHKFFFHCRAKRATKYMNPTRAEKGRAVKRAVRSWANV